MSGNVIMVVGTSSSAGKSLLVAGLCRLYARRGIKVAPFKAQNMSNNAGVCTDGSEIGRAQMTQAFAAGIEPTAMMNPVLLKPESNMRSQVVVMGRASETLSARNYFERKQALWGVVTDALDDLRSRYELVIIEGAGSPAELNLKKNDIVNMAVARYAEAPTLLVGDIDRGGIFAQLLGTYWLLPAEEQALIAGFVVNKFRGDRTLFEDGVQILEEKSGVPVVGVLPWLEKLYLPEEDGVALDDPRSGLADRSQSEGAIDIAVIQLPKISNFDDFDPLIAEPAVQVRFVSEVERLGEPDAIILPGTKSTISDLQWLNATGFAEEIAAKVNLGTPLVGICGGYQMLGQAVHDPNLVEATTESEPGLGYLPFETSFVGIKATHQVVGRITRAASHWAADLVGSSITGYEIHMGQTESRQPWIEINGRGGESVSVSDGWMREDGMIWGCYLHGLFENDHFRRAWLRSLGGVVDEDSLSHVERLNRSLDRLADQIESVFGEEWIRTLGTGAQKVE